MTAGEVRQVLKIATEVLVPVNLGGDIGYVHVSKSEITRLLKGLPSDAECNASFDNGTLYIG